MSKKYKNPPLVEIYCDFQFVPGQPWDMTIPGLIYEKLKDKFPDKQQQNILSLNISQKEGGVEQKAHTLEKMQFYNKTKTALVQIGIDLLSINHLSPYPKWNAFKPIILDNLNIYREVAKPKGLKRVELRCINKINFEQEKVTLEEYFNYYPHFGDGLPQEHDAFFVRTEIQQKNKQDTLIMILGILAPEKPDRISFVLDLSYIMTLQGKISIEQIPDWIENAHHVVEETFEACITDHARILFGEEK